MSKYAGTKTEANLRAAFAARLHKRVFLSVCQRAPEQKALHQLADDVIAVGAASPVAAQQQLAACPVGC